MMVVRVDLLGSEHGCHRLERGLRKVRHNEDVEAAEREAAVAVYPTGDESLPDFDLERARRRCR